MGFILTIQEGKKLLELPFSSEKLGWNEVERRTEGLVPGIKILATSRYKNILSFYSPSKGLCIYFVLREKKKEGEI